MLAERVETRVREDLEESHGPRALPQVRLLRRARRRSRPDANVRLERLVHDGLERALAESHDARGGRRAPSAASRLREIIDTGDVRTLVHPILELDDLHGHRLRGAVARARGRRVRAARQAVQGRLRRRPRAAARAAVPQARRSRRRPTCPTGGCCSSTSSPRPSPTPSCGTSCSPRCSPTRRCTPDRIVLEITERTAIVDFAAFRAHARVPARARLLGRRRRRRRRLRLAAVPRRGAARVAQDRHLARSRHRHRRGAAPARRRASCTFAEQMGVQLDRRGHRDPRGARGAARAGRRLRAGLPVLEPVAPFPPTRT